MECNLDKILYISLVGLGTELVFNHIKWRVFVSTSVTSHVLDPETLGFCIRAFLHPSQLFLWSRWSRCMNGCLTEGRRFRKWCDQAKHPDMYRGACRLRLILDSILCVRLVSSKNYCCAFGMRSQRWVATLGFQISSQGPGCAPSVLQPALASKVITHRLNSLTYRIQATSFWPPTQ